MHESLSYLYTIDSYTIDSFMMRTASAEMGLLGPGKVHGVRPAIPSRTGSQQGMKGMILTNHSLCFLNRNPLPVQSNPTTGIGRSLPIPRSPRP